MPTRRGRFSLQAAGAQANITLASPFLTLVSKGAALPDPQTLSLTGMDGGPMQLTGNHLAAWDAYYNFHQIHGWLASRQLTNSDQASWAEKNVTVFVELPSGCNAYYNPNDESLNFFNAQDNCINTATSPFVVHHEFGHSIEFHSGNGEQFDTSISEGLADVTGMLSTDLDSLPGLTTGCAGKLRTCDNAFSWCDSGCTYGPSTEGHTAGQVICAVWRELRDGLGARYGATLGRAITHALFLEHLGLIAGSMPDTYHAAIQMDVDDDDDPTNGTRHSCEINEAFATAAAGGVKHFPKLAGMVPAAPSLAILHEPPGRVDAAGGAPLTLTATLRPHPVCNAGDLPGAAEVIYTVDGNAAVRRAPLVTHETDSYLATLADVAAPATVRYAISATLAGSAFVYPYPWGEPMDPNQPALWQTVRYAADQIVYQNDFETGQDTGGLVLGSDAADGRSAWAAGPALGLGGDPFRAQSGNQLLGANLLTAGDDRLSGHRTSVVTLPMVDAHSLTSVHLTFFHLLLNAAASSIEVNGQPVYTVAGAKTFARDADWRFEDVDITALAAGRADVEIKFIMRDLIDTASHLSGWNIDALQVAGTPVPAAGGQRQRHRRGDVSPTASATPGPAARRRRARRPRGVSRPAPGGRYEAVGAGAVEPRRRAPLAHRGAPLRRRGVPPPGRGRRSPSPAAPPASGGSPGRPSRGWRRGWRGWGEGSVRPRSRRRPAPGAPRRRRRRRRRRPGGFARFSPAPRGSPGRPPARGCAPPPADGRASDCGRRHRATSADTG